MPKEIITLQFGHYSNFVGAHYWNFLDDLFITSDSEAGLLADSSNDSHDSSYCNQRDEGKVMKNEYFEKTKLFRASSSEYKRNERWYPRVLMFDSKDHFGSLCREGSSSNTYNNISKNGASNNLTSNSVRNDIRSEIFDNLLWEGPKVVVNSEPEYKSQFMHYLEEEDELRR